MGAGVPLPSPAASSCVPAESVNDSHSGPSKETPKVPGVPLGERPCAGMRGLGTPSTAAGGVIVGGTSQNLHHHPVTEDFFL